jgi:alkaline phosphatase D
MVNSLSLNRRKALMALGLGGAVPAIGASAPLPPEGAHFKHGVASGDPLQDRVIIWTRVSGLSQGADIHWQVSIDQDFKSIVRKGKVYTDKGQDYTVKVDVTGLRAGQTYYYRFLTKGIVSPSGRTQTLPQTTKRLVMVAASCSLHSNGYFNAYRAIADLAELDVVLHLGDYLYEYGAMVNDYGMVNGQVLGRIPEPTHEIVSLSDYRLRHAHYKADIDLQAAHARAPWICVFDDHEMTNDPWMSGAENHNPEKGEGNFFERKTIALKAYREWMPIRDPQQGLTTDAIYRSFRFGQLAEIFMLETRFLARTKQLDYSTDLTQNSDGTYDLTTFKEKLNAPSRELLGAAQRDWLGKSLKDSVASNVRWQVFGNQIIMARVAGPNFKKLYDGEMIKTLLSHMSSEVLKTVAPMVNIFSQDENMPLNLDAWDGYPAERERFYDLIKQAKARPIVLSGDSHSAWANQLSDASGKAVAVEIGVTAISSPTVWFDNLIPGFNLAQTLATQNAEVIDANTEYNGFVRLTLTPEAMTAEWMSISTLMSREFTVSVQKVFQSKAEAPLLTIV